MASKTYPDLIIMNIKLVGKIDGVEAYEVIKKINDIPVLFVSAYTDANTIEKAMLNNPKGYLTKPFKVAHLLRKVEKALAGDHNKSEGRHAHYF
jgi:DNA-binding NarL/FixJ family response regulator